MVLSPVTPEEVVGVVRDFRLTRSCDAGGLSVWLLKTFICQVSEPLSKLVNMSFDRGLYPAELKKSKITPIFKKNDPLLVENYRPIAILPTLSKIYEKLYLNRLMAFLNSFNLLCSQQFGFRKNKSTIDAVTSLVESVVGGLEGGEQVLGVFLDLSKAFDCVSHAALLRVLETSGVRGLPLRWLESYLAGRSQRVQVTNSLSRAITVGQGVPQGSILGPALFIIYVNNLSFSLQAHNIIQYADDTTLCLKNKSVEELEINTFIQLNSCIQFFQHLNLQTNSTKSNFIYFRLRQLGVASPLSVMVDDTLLREVDCTSFLGVHVDGGLTWNSHVDSVCSRVSKGIYVLRSLAQFCSLGILKMTYFGIVYPHLSYGIRLWGGCAVSRFSRVFRLQKKAVRVLASLKHRESCRNAFKELGLLTLPCLYLLEVAVYCRFSGNLTQGVDIHEHNTRGRDVYRQQRHRTSAFNNLPSQVGVRVLNRLPNSLVVVDDKATFKRKLKHLLIKRSFYSMEEFMAHRFTDDPQ